MVQTGPIIRGTHTAMLLCILCFVAAVVTGSCGNEQAQRQHWQDCGDTFHEECWPIGGDPVDARACEYEYYKECINGT